MLLCENGYLYIKAISEVDIFAHRKLLFDWGKYEVNDLSTVHIR